ncbi:MAG: diguanylate cyclase, partial [Gallionella sp.]
VVRGDLAHDYAITLGLASQLVLVDTAADAMRMLASGKGDVVLLSKLVGMLTLQELDIHNVAALPAKLGVVQKFSFAVQSGQRPLLDRINEAMVITSVQGTYGKLHEKWFGVYEDHHTDTSKLMLSALPVALLFLAGWGHTYFKSRKERLATESKLRTLYTAMEQSPISVVITSIDANIEYVNPRFSEVTGYSSKEAIGRNPRILQSSQTPNETFVELWGKLTSGQPWHGELINKRKNGEIYWEDAHIAPVKDMSGKITHYVAAKVDITERKRIEELNKQSEERLHFILENSPIAVRITSMRTHAVIFANHSYNELIGMTPEAVIGIDPRIYYAQQHDYEYVLEQLGRGRRITNRLMELSIPSLGNMTKWALASYLQLEYNGEAAVLGWFYDITDRKAMEEQVQRLAQYDPLTDLPNRRLFSDRLQQALALAERDRTRLAVMFLDLDRFKPINDKYGHAMGDVVLKEVATRIQSSLRASDTLARIGGDEFVVLLPNVSSVHDVVGVAEKVREVLNQPFIVDGQVMSLSSSAGIALYPEHGDTEQSLVRNADTAMYYAKEDGRNNVQVYHPEMSARESVNPL